MHSQVLILPPGPAHYGTLLTLMSSDSGPAALSALTKDRYLLCAAAGLRSLCVGMTGVLLALYLHLGGWNVSEAGLLVTIGLAGTAVATLLTSLLADRAGRRRILLLLALLNSAGYAAAAWMPGRAIFLVAAFFGMLNGLGRDRGPAYALEQAMLPQTVPPARRTFALAWYSLTLDAGLAVGSLMAGIPYWLAASTGRDLLASFQTAWWSCAAVAGVAAICPLLLSPSMEAESASNKALLPVSPESRRRIAGLAALTGMDSLGGGFLTGALVSYWFFARFDVGGEWLGPLFFAARIVNAASHLAAAWLAARIGLLNTMVFTHIPSSLFLIAVPFAPDAWWAAALFLAREALVEMDVPTRQSYILAVVHREERAFASGMTTLTRNIAYAAAPVAAGHAMRSLALASPLFLGAGIKIAYDLLLYFSFRRIRPPEEA